MKCNEVISSFPHPLTPPHPHTLTAPPRAPGVSGGPSRALSPYDRGEKTDDQHRSEFGGRSPQGAEVALRSPQGPGRKSEGASPFRAGTECDLGGRAHAG